MTKIHLISSLSNLISENKGAIKEIEDEIIESFDIFAKEKRFYKLPTDEILKIVEKSAIKDVKLLYEVISMMCENKGDESVLLLNIIDPEEMSLDECIEVISRFVRCQICKRTGELYTKEYNHMNEELNKEKDENKNLAERDFGYEIGELKKEIEKIKKATGLRIDIEKPSDFESDICKAAEEGKLTSIQYLYEACHANVEAKDIKGCTPINIASINSHLEVVKYLYETCHANVETKDNSGRTPIFNASKKGHLEVVKYLYETCHANVETKDNYERTPINNASHDGYLDIVKYLYETCHMNIGANVGKCSPLNFASVRGHLEVVKYIYEQSHANVEIRDCFGRSPISNASIYGHLNVVKYLNEACHANVETKDEDGMTPINKASEKGYLDIVKYLYETCHADVETKNNYGFTPINNASYFDHIEVVKYLYETCHAKIPNKFINKASGSCKEYLESKH